MLHSIGNISYAKTMMRLTALYCFFVIVNLPYKDIAFILLTAGCAWTYRKIETRYVLLFISIYILFIATFLIGVSSDYLYDYGFTHELFLSFTPLILLLWIDKLDIVRAMTFPAVIISLFVIFITFAIFWFPDIEAWAYLYLDRKIGLIMMSNRYFLGIKFTNVFYRTLPLVIIPYSIYCYKYWFEKTSRYRNLLLTAIFAAALFFSGTRACMLSAILIFAGMPMLKLLRIKGGMLVLYPIISLFAIGFCILLWMLMSETKEPSNLVKYGHLKSYLDFFDNNMSALLWGQGPGGMFYTEGWHTYVSQTEWTFIELIRYFGIPGAVWILAIFIYPCIVIYKKKNTLQYFLPFTIGYILYILVSGTNPLLISTTGMLALLAAYSYASNPVYCEK